MKIGRSLDVLNSDVSESVVGTHWFCLPRILPLPCGSAMLTLPLPGVGVGPRSNVTMSSWAQWPEVSCDTTTAYQRELHAIFWRKQKRGTFLSFLFSAAPEVWRHTSIMAGNLLLLRGESLLRMGANTLKRWGESCRETVFNDIF